MIKPEPPQNIIIKDIELGICQETHEYYCKFCKQWSDKSLWGPGRITCPNCNKRVLSPAEIIEQNEYEEQDQRLRIVE